MPVRTYAQYCPIVRAVEVLGDRWTLLILREMITGTRRFNDLSRGLPGLSRALLSRRLRELEAAGLVIKATEGEPGYELTAAGRDLEQLVFGALARHEFGERRRDVRDVLQDLCGHRGVEAGVGVRDVGGRSDPQVDRRSASPCENVTSPVRPSAATAGPISGRDSVSSASKSPPSLSRAPICGPASPATPHPVNTRP